MCYLRASDFHEIYLFLDFSHLFFRSVILVSCNVTAEVTLCELYALTKIPYIVRPPTHDIEHDLFAEKYYYQAVGEAT